MIAFRNVAEILAKSLDWERKLKDLYDVAEIALRNEESRKTVAVLRDSLQKKLEVLRGVKPEAHGNAEWVRYAGDFNEEDLISKQSITRDSSPDEIMAHIVTYQKHLQDFYSRIAEALVSRNQKDLFESLALFKAEQIEEVGRIGTTTR